MARTSVYARSVQAKILHVTGNVESLPMLNTTHGEPKIKEEPRSGPEYNNHGTVSNFSFNKCADYRENKENNQFVFEGLRISLSKLENDLKKMLETATKKNCLPDRKRKTMHENNSCIAKEQADCKRRRVHLDGLSSSRSQDPPFLEIQTDMRDEKTSPPRLEIEVAAERHEEKDMSCFSPIFRRERILPKFSKCKTCGLEFETPEQLKSHENHYSKDGHFECGICHIRFGWKYQLGWHNKSAHSFSAGHRFYKFTCHLCNQRFVKKTGLQAHLSHLHDQKTTYEAITSNRNAENNDEACRRERSAHDNQAHKGAKPLLNEQTDKREVKHKQEDAATRLENHTDYEDRSHKQDAESEQKKVEAELKDKPVGNGSQTFLKNTPSDEKQPSKQPDGEEYFQNKQMKHGMKLGSTTSDEGHTDDATSKQPGNEGYGKEVQGQFINSKDDGITIHLSDMVKRRDAVEDKYIINNNNKAEKNILAGSSTTSLLHYEDPESRIRADEIWQENIEKLSKDQANFRIESVLINTLSNQSDERNVLFSKENERSSAKYKIGVNEGNTANFESRHNSTECYYDHSTVQNENQASPYQNHVQEAQDVMRHKNIEEDKMMIPLGNRPCDLNANDKQIFLDSNNQLGEEVLRFAKYAAPENMKTVLPLKDINRANYINCRQFSIHLMRIDEFLRKYKPSIASCQKSRMKNTSLEPVSRQTRSSYSNDNSITEQKPCLPKDDKDPNKIGLKDASVTMKNAVGSPTKDVLKIASDNKEGISHDKNQTYSCDTCIKEFSSKDVLRKHINWTHSQFVCKICDDQFARKDRLIFHYLLRHTESGNSKCCVCERSCSNYLNLKKHLSLHCSIRNVKSSNAQCEINKKKLGAATDLKMDYGQCNLNAEIHKCEECKKQFLTKSNLKFHRNICKSGDKGIISRLENGSSYSSQDCKIGVNTVELEKGEKLKTTKRLSKYVKNDEVNTVRAFEGTNKRKYVCDVCRKMFAGKSRLNHHFLMSHTNVRYYTCKSCKKGFIWQSELQAHKCKKPAIILVKNLKQSREIKNRSDERTAVKTKKQKLNSHEESQTFVDYEQFHSKSRTIQEDSHTTLHEMNANVNFYFENISNTNNELTEITRDSVDGDPLDTAKPLEIKSSKRFDSLLRPEVSEYNADDNAGKQPASETGKTFSEPNSSKSRVGQIGAGTSSSAAESFQNLEINPVIHKLTVRNVACFDKLHMSINTALDKSRPDFNDNDGTMEEIGRFSDIVDNLKSPDHTVVLSSKSGSELKLDPESDDSVEAVDTLDGHMDGTNINSYNTSGIQLVLRPLQPGIPPLSPIKAVDSNRKLKDVCGKRKESNQSTGYFPGFFPEKHGVLNDNRKAMKRNDTQEGDIFHSNSSKNRINLKTIHNSYVTGNFECNICHAIFATFEGLSHHQTSCSTSIEVLFDCDICHRKFTSEKSLILHKKCDHILAPNSCNQEKYTCSYCSETFALEFELHCHMKCAHLIGNTTTQCNSNQCSNSLDEIENRRIFKLIEDTERTESRPENSACSSGESKMSNKDELHKFGKLKVKSFAKIIENLTKASASSVDETCCESAEYNMSSTNFEKEGIKLSRNMRHIPTILKKTIDQNDVQNYTVEMRNDILRKRLMKSNLTKSTNVLIIQRNQMDMSNMADGSGMNSLNTPVMEAEKDVNVTRLNKSMEELMDFDVKLANTHNGWTECAASTNNNLEIVQIDRDASGSEEIDSHQSFEILFDNLGSNNNDLITRNSNHRSSSKRFAVEGDEHSQPNHLNVPSSRGPLSENQIDQDVSERKLIRGKILHRKLISVRKIFTCTMCSMTFEERAQLTRHAERHKTHRWQDSSLNFHSDTRTFFTTCGICDQRFSTEEILNKHMESHHYCGVCKETISSVTNIREHMKQHTEQNQRIKCGLCMKEFAMLFQVVAHFRDEHSSFACSACDARFTSKNGLLRHMPSHSGAFHVHIICDKCCKGFVQQTDYYKHICKPGQTETAGFQTPIDSPP